MRENEHATSCNIGKKMMHPIILKAMKKKIRREHTITGKLPKKGPYLIVSNSIGSEDIPTLTSAVRKHVYIATGKDDKNVLERLLLDLNGVEWKDHDDEDKVNNHLAQIIRKKKRLVVFPENTYNISPNQLILPLDDNCIKLALEENIPIVPVVSHIDWGYYTMIGEPFYPTKDIEKSKEELRDIMATMLYSELEKRNIDASLLSPKISTVWVEGERQYCFRRKELKEGYQDEFVLELYKGNLELRKEERINSSFDQEYFQEFNSIVRENANGIEIRRISSEKDGYMGPNFGEESLHDSFGYGYNSKALRKTLKR